MTRERWIAAIVAVLMLCGAASSAFATGEPEDPANCDCAPDVVFSGDRKTGQIEEPGIIVESDDRNLEVRFFGPVLDVPFGEPIGPNDFVFIKSQQDLERPIQATELRGLANIDIFLVLNERSDERGRVRVERSIHSVDPDRSKATIRFTQEFLADRAGVKPGDFQSDDGGLRLLFEMVEGALVPHSTAIELGYISQLRFAPDFTWVEFDVYVWRTDDLMVYIG